MCVCVRESVVYMCLEHDISLSWGGVWQSTGFLYYWSFRCAKNQITETLFLWAPWDYYRLCLQEVQLDRDVKKWLAREAVLWPCPHAGLTLALKRWASSKLHCDLSMLEPGASGCPAPQRLFLGPSYRKHTRAAQSLDHWFLMSWIPGLGSLCLFS